LNFEKSSRLLKTKPPSFLMRVLLVAHQDLNLRPKDYESGHPKKTFRISVTYIS
jgi:hypothetical protein